MKSVVLSTAAWPNLHYLFHLLNSDQAFIEQHETYPRQTFRNRYEILTANGVLSLTIPVKRSGNHTKTKDVLIDYSSDWQTQHWRALTSAYRKSPYFDHFEDELRIFYTGREEHLLKHNCSQLKFIGRVLRLEMNFQLTDNFQKSPETSEDLRDITDPKTKFEEDAEASAVLKQPYYQTFGEKFAFVPNLSCLDLLFNVGLRAKEYLRDLSGHQKKIIS